MFIYIRKEAVLLYFIDEGRIDDFEGVIQPSDWLKLSEKSCARANAGAVAAERIEDYRYYKVSVKILYAM
jgi:hypothetical protein